jgi:hypothetical protein
MRSVAVNLGLWHLGTPGFDTAQKFFDGRRRRLNFTGSLANLKNNARRLIFYLYLNNTEQLSNVYGCFEYTYGDTNFIVGRACP